MKQVHGTFTNFKDMGIALGFKVRKEKPEKAHKCENCGGPMHRAGNSNVWVCDFHKLTDEKLPDGTDVQVFAKCENIVIERV